MLLFVLALVFLGGSVSSAQQGVSTGVQAAASAEIPSWIQQSSGDGAARREPFSMGGMGRSMAALVLVLGGLSGAHYFLRKRVSAWACPVSAQLKILTRCRLGARQELVVVDWGGERFMLGVSPSGIRRLHTRTEPASPAVESMQDGGQAV